MNVSQALQTYLADQGIPSETITQLSSSGGIRSVETAELGRVLALLLQAPSEVEAAAFKLRNLIGNETRLRANWFAGDASTYTTNLRSFPAGRLDAVVDPDRLAKRLENFTEDRLQVDWRPGPPYRLASEEVDPLLTEEVWAQRIVTVRRILTDDQLRNPATRVLWSFAPIDDFTQEIEVGDKKYVQHGYGFTGASTFVNPPELQLYDDSPSYALAFLEAALPRERGVEFLEPPTFEDFQRKIDEVRPELVLLSGLGMNTEILLKMALYARNEGAKEVWLGNYAALGPYPVLREAFDRLYWGLGERYLYHQLVGDGLVSRVHPPVDRMTARLSWLSARPDQPPVRYAFETLHMAVGRGCARTCHHCAETAFAGGVEVPFPIDQLKSRIDEARTRGIRHVYFLDPNFGLRWEDAAHAEIIRYLHSQGMTFSLLAETGLFRDRAPWLADQGLVNVFLGIESLSPAYAKADTLKAPLGRSWQKMSETEELIQLLRDLGVETTGLYMLANPGETLEDSFAGVDRLASLVARSQISTDTPFPGTDQFYEGIRHGWIHNFHPKTGLMYGRSGWAPGGKVLDPEETRAAWVTAHERINRVDRPGGLLDQQLAKISKKQGSGGGPSSSDNHSSQGSGDKKGTSSMAVFPFLAALSYGPDVESHQPIAFYDDNPASALESPINEIEPEVDQAIYDEALQIAEENEWSGAYDTLLTTGAEVVNLVDTSKEREKLYVRLTNDNPWLAPVLEMQEGTDAFPALLLSTQLALQNGDDISMLEQLTPHHSWAVPAPNGQYFWTAMPRASGFATSPLARVV